MTRVRREAFVIGDPHLAKAGNARQVPTGLRTTLLGAKVTAVPGGGRQPSGEAGIFTLANRQFTSIGLSQTPFYAVGCCRTDGRYLLISYDTAPGTTCGACHLTYYSYDLNTKTLWQIAKGTDPGGVGTVLNDHGLVLLGTGQGIEVVDLTTHHVTQMQAPVSGATDARLWAFTWPYVIYSVSQPAQPSGGGTSTTRARDLETNQDIALPQVDAIGGGAMSIAGDTLFITQGVTNDPQANIYVTSLFEDDAFFTSSAPPRRLASYAGEFGVGAANNRLAAFSYGVNGVVWDRAEQRFVQVTASTDPSSFILPATSLAGHFLAVMQLIDPNGGSDAQQVTIYDTNTLRTTPPTTPSA